MKNDTDLLSGVVGRVFTAAGCLAEPGGPSMSSASGNPQFDYAPGQPNLFRMMCYKRDLLSRMEPQKALAEFRETFGWPRSSGLRRVPISSERDFAEARGVVFRETGVAGIPFINDPPPVLGESNSRPLRGITRSQYVACLPNARTRGRSSVVYAGDQLLIDFQRGELERVDEHFSWDPSILHADEGAALYLEAASEAEPLKFAEAFNLLGAHTDFFGHWMCEYLPKLVHALLSGLLTEMPVLIDANMPLAHRRSLELLFPDLGPIVEIPSFASISVDRLWVAPDISYYPLYDDGTGRFQWDAISAAPERIGPVVKELRRRADESFKGEIHCERRVFLARKPSRHRRLVNDDEILGEARSSGFSICYPEDFSFDEQLAFMRGAREIIAQEGSAVFLAQFAPSEARVCILSHPMTEPMSDHNTICRAAGLDLCGFTGPLVHFAHATPHDSNYRIEKDRFSTFLEDWLGANEGSKMENSHR